MENLTEKETKLLKSLIRLGDSKKLALKTVLAGRKKNFSTEMYELAYYS